MNNKMSNGHRQNATPSEAKVLFKQQSYEEIRARCLKSGTLFEDPFFPAISSSIGIASDKNYEWKRPGELVSNPELFVDGVSRFDVQQGELGNCWFVAAVASLSQFSDLFSKVIPPKDCRSFDKTKGYTGLFRFNFWVFGEWTEVVVDDRLPSSNGQLRLVHSSQKNEFWSSLLEKAYAKLNGSYENLLGGSASDAMEDFTGGVVEVFELQKDAPPSLFKMMTKAHQRHSLMGCSVNIPNAPPEQKLANGLIVGHAYSVTGTRTVSVKRTPVELLRVRNPWGNEEEWNGAWSDKSTEWNELSQTDRDEMEVAFNADGEFWISFKDFMKNFTKVEICHLGPDFDEIDETSTKKRWEMTMERGSWKKHVNAGGCLNNKGTFFTNPQFRVTVTDPDEDDDDDTGTLIVAVLQRRRPSHNLLMKLGYMIYKLEDPNCGPLDADFFKYNRPAGMYPSFNNRREICGRYKLAPGHYCIIPSTFEAGVEGDFLLRFFTEKPVTSQELDEGTVVLKVEVPPTPTVKEPNNERETALRSAFAKIVGEEEQELDAVKLKEILTAAFGHETKTHEFTLDTCRSIVAIKDFNNSGRLGFDEFKDLWTDLKAWKNEFLRADVDKSGNLDSSELRSSIRNIGISVSNSALQSLVQRFSDNNGKIYFNDYIHCIAKLTTMYKKFTNKSQGLPEAKFSLDEFLITTMYT